MEYAALTLRASSTASRVQTAYPANEFLTGSWANWAGRSFMYLKNSNLKTLYKIVRKQLIIVLLVLLDTINNQFGALLNHDCIITLKCNVGRMLSNKVWDSRECMEACASTRLSQHSEISVDCVCVECLQSWSEMMNDFKWLVIFTSSV